ncbi:MAG TPA: hypothetical protein VM943_05130 [Pyrinomonadaceae bacterium]|nr:hypothetical protein [Pyrinomonadaceae bacterium]
MLKFSLPLLILIASLSSGTRAQTAPTPTASPTPAPPPATEIFIVGVVRHRGELKMGKPESITPWGGYNNQPMFLRDGRGLLYASVRADRQADIYRYDIIGRSTERLTDTSESEYSPTITPDGRFFSTIRVEADGTQRLWKFPLAGGRAVLVLDRIKPVGYHAWIDADRLVLFVLGTPSTMQFADVRTQESEKIAENIGRSLHRIPRQNRISFVHKMSEQEWVIKAHDLKSRVSIPLIKTLPGSEDYAWTPEGILLMARDAKLFQWDPSRDRDWREVADFSAAGLHRITRIAVSPKGDRVALVTQGATPR